MFSAGWRHEVFLMGYSHIPQRFATRADAMRRATCATAQKKCARV
jgi:hypothetical protein